MSSKTSLFISILFLFSACAYAGHAPARDTLECLELSGSVSVEGDSTDNVTVELVLNNSQVEVMDVHSFQPFKFHLQRDQVYTVKLSKKMFIGKSISVNTELPKGFKIKSLFKFHFETDLVRAPDLKSQRADALDFPIALIRFDETKKHFEYSQKYNDMINDQIDKDMYKIYGGDGPPEEASRQQKEKKEKKKK